MNYLKTRDGSIELSLYIQPGASKSRLLGEHDGALKIAIQSPPVDGKANKALIAYIAELTDISKKSIEIVRGEKSRKKCLRLHQASLETIEEAIRRALPDS